MARRIVPAQEGVAVALRRSTRVQSTSTSVARTAVVQETEDSTIRAYGQAVVSTETQIEMEETSRPKRRRQSNSRKTKPEVTTGGVEEDVVDEDDGTAKPKKKRRRVKEEPVYIIPDVEKKQTTFKGRLGYACLNTVLRNKRPASDSIFCSRTCRIDSINKHGMEWVKALGTRNVQDLLLMIQWNEDNNIKFMRLSSEMFPFASHSKYGYSLDYCADLLAQAGALANKYGHRLTTHPGQYTQLGSNKPAVIDSAIRELEYHSEMLDLMGIGPDGVMIIHGGGVYDDKAATIERIKHTISNRLPRSVRDRLVLENDEMCYNAEELLAICEELDVPLVFDYHHDLLNPSSIPPSAIIARANAIFAKRGIRPKQHLSEPRPGAVTLMERRAHADRCENLPADLPDDMDLMVEAKDKEQAVLHLYRMYDLAEVKYESLRPPAANQTKETKGRKSNKRAAAKDGKGGKTKKKGKGKGKQDDDSEEEAEEEYEEEEEEEEDLDEALDNMEDEPTYVAEVQIASPGTPSRTSRRRAAQSVPVA